VDLLLSEDQRSIVSSVAEVLDDLMSVERVREILAGDRSSLTALWRSAAELGWFGIGLAEEHGGTGFELVDEALLFVELGRRVTPGPFLATTLAARVAALGGASGAAAKLLSGEVEAGIAVPRSDGSFALHDAVGAAYVLTLDETGARLFDAAEVVDRKPWPGLDPLVPRETAAALSGEAVAFVPAEQESIEGRGSVLVSAQLAGIAAAARDMSVGYAKTREQFGSPIGAFQAVKHRCADMAVGAALADAQLTFAALSLSESAPDAAFQVSAARVVAERAAMDNARETIQIYGGIGVTWECDAHLYLKRVHALRDLHRTSPNSRKST
jgi:alkylation response protein AidB-like acyl-CoA dehydrogenase